MKKIVKLSLIALIIIFLTVPIFLLLGIKTLNSVSILGTITVIKY